MIDNFEEVQKKEITGDEIYKPKEPNSSKRRKFFFVFIGILFVFCFFYFNTPKIVSYPISVSFESGENLRDLSSELEEKGVVRSGEVFEIFFHLSGNEEKIQAGEYFFDRPHLLSEVVDRIISGDFGVPVFKTTFPEGFDRFEMTETIAEKFGEQTSNDFFELSLEKEGYLFPDTYFFPKNSSASAIVDKLENNFSKKTNSLKIEAEAKGLDWEEVIILASIIEEEASGKGDREMISGILQKRISKGIRLQADATVFYGMKVAGVSGDFDSDFDSEYNTYLHSGLPPKPITNPGILSIEAAINPKYSDYLYYLHDKEGNVYYAKTYDEHRTNINKYLK